MPLKILKRPHGEPDTILGLKFKHIRRLRLRLSVILDILNSNFINCLNGSFSHNVLLFMCHFQAYSLHSNNIINSIHNCL